MAVTVWQLYHGRTSRDGGAEPMALAHGYSATKELITGDLWTGFELDSKSNIKTVA